ncbi:hypothetical protein VE03_05149 [Pseudogymnoascus sp. 23342-1-I1]|nr:hypothetical protein VE03_05149 [Pseudogymnoascus sp. 23342-1-I1]
MPSLKQSRSKRATPIAIVSNKGSRSQWHDPKDTEVNSPPPTAFAAMSTAEPISAPGAGEAEQTPRSLTFFDLPSETQNAIIKQCTTTDLISLSLVSKHFRDLAAARIYRYFRIIFPDDDDGNYESDMDGLAAGLDTIVTSEYDYARYVKLIDIESLSGGAKGERAYRHYTNDLSCGKFMNTLFLLTLRKAKKLVTFRWDVRVELSRPVYKSLHDIPALKHLYLRMHTGLSLYQRPPPLPSLKCFPDDISEMVKKVTKSMKGSLEAPSMKMTNAEAKAILASHAKDLKTDHGPPTISGFKNLKTLAILDMDSLEYVKEIKTCIHSSSATLKKLKLSFSETLAKKARKPPPADDTGDESEQDIDEFGNTVPPPPIVAPSSTDDSSGPGKAFRAVEAKQAQDAALAQIFGLDTKAKEAPKEAPKQAPGSDVSEQERKSNSLLEDTVYAFIQDFTALTDAPSSSEFTPEQKEFTKAVEKVTEKYLKGKMKSLGLDTTKYESEEGSTAGSSNEKATPSSASDTSETGKVDKEGKAKDTEPEAGKVDKEGEAKDTEPEAGKVDKEGEAKDTEPGLFDNEDKKASKANQSTIDNPQPEDIDICDPEVELDPQDDDESTSELVPQTTNDEVLTTAVESAKSSTPKNLGPTPNTTVDGTEWSTPKKPGLIPTTAVESTEPSIPEKPRLAEPSDRDILEIALATRALQGSRFHDLEVDSLQYNVIKEAAEAHNKSLEQNDNAMSEYVRTTRGLTLKSLSIYLIPIRASVLSRAVDLHVLVRISLLSVGPQAPLWNYLARQNQISPLPLCKIHTDNVTVNFLKFVSQLENLVELFILERSAKGSESSIAPKTTATSDNIRRYVLKRHASSLMRLVVKNENDYTWDADVKFLELLCRQGKNLTELGISFASPALHTFNQYLPSLVSLKALHIINFRNDDTCHWVMREIPRFIADALSSHPSMKLEYLAVGSTVGRLIWKPKPVSKPEDKGKTITNMYTGEVILIPQELLGESESESESDEEDDSAHGLRLEFVDCGRFYDIPGVHMWKKDALLGRL